MNEESQVIFLEYFFKGLQKEANLSIPESMGVITWFACQNPEFNKIAAAAAAPTMPDPPKAPIMPDPPKAPIMPAPPAGSPPVSASPGAPPVSASPGAPTMPAPPRGTNPNDKLQPLIDALGNKITGIFKPNPNTIPEKIPKETPQETTEKTPKETTEKTPKKTTEETAEGPGVWEKFKNFFHNTKALAHVATLSPEELEKQKNQATAAAGREAGKTILNGVGSFFKGMAPYAVPGILGYLALRAAGTEGGTAALGGLAAGAIGGSLWKDPSNKDQVDSMKKWFDSDPPPAKEPAVALNNVRTEAQRAAADTTNTAISASKQLNSPSPIYTA